MKKNLLFQHLAFLLLCSPIFAQKTSTQATISGYIEDANSGEKLYAAGILDRLTVLGVVSNNYGFYSLTLPKGKVNLFSSYVGFEGQSLDFDLQKDTIIDFKLRTIAELQTVEINAKKQDRIENKVQMSQVTVPIEQIKKIPALLGEVDVLKALQLLPGVQSGGEGQNGLYVRGGSPDQNLVLLDGVPVYNVSHLGGFFSVFNGDAIKNVTLTKGGFPARYGGRLSSVLEIDMKEGNMKEFHGEGGIGLITSRLTLEGPIKKDKASFMISGRRTYFDVLARPIIKSIEKDNNSFSNYKTDTDLALYFYDLNAKINYKLNDQHRFFLSAYSGKDILNIDVKENNTQNKDYYRTDGGTNWGNLTTAARWNYVINNRLFANTTVTYSQFQFQLKALTESRYNDTIYDFNAARYRSGIYDVAAKVDFDYSPIPNHHIKFGVGNTYHTYNPGALQVQVQSQETKIDTALGNVKKTYAHEIALYAEDEIQRGALKANVGLHASGFVVGGKFYKSLQPRLGLNYLLKNDIALKGSYANMYQFINLLTNESIGLPTDLWVPSTARIRPQESWQAAIGAAKTWKEEYEISVEAYYKKMKNVISYREGASFLGNQSQWEDKITQGQGRAYGMEFFMQKKQGRTTGWIGYTLSWNFRQFDEINDGKEYAFKYDRRHDISLVFSHQFTKKFSLTATYVYGTGNAITLPEVRFTSYEQENNNYAYEYTVSGDKNKYRMPSFQRLDVNLEWKKKKRRYTRTWNVGAYNALNRANPYSIILGSKEIKDNSDNTKYVPTFRQLSIFPIVPSVSYGFKF